MGKLEPSKENFAVGGDATMAKTKMAYLAIDNVHMWIARVSDALG